MKNFYLLIPVFLVCGIGLVSAQNPAPVYPPDPINNISIELTSISRSVAALNERMKVFVEKFEKVGGTTFSEKQQKLVLGLEFLVRSEERLMNLQKAQIEFVEKQGTTRTRLAQVERDAFPQSIDRSVAFEGTTKTEELRESKRTTLQAERASLQALLNQINSTLNDVNEALREAQVQVQRLRKLYLPQMEREIYEQ